jgi:hypothetical protein
LDASAKIMANKCQAVIEKPFCVVSRIPLLATVQRPLRYLKSAIVNILSDIVGLFSLSPSSNVYTRLSMFKLERIAIVVTAENCPGVITQN